MLGLLYFLITGCGICVLLNIVIKALSRDDTVLTRIIGNIGIFAAKIAGILVAVSFMILVSTSTYGILSFTTIGIYVACGALIVSGIKDFMDFISGYSIFGNLATVAAAKASSFESDLAKRAEELAEKAKKEGSTSTPDKHESSNQSPSNR